MSKKETLRLTLNVTYKPHGVPVEKLQSRLEYALSHAIGEGLLTGETAAEVDTHSFNVEVIPQPKKEKKAKGRFHEGSFSAFAHRISFYYRLPPRKRISKEDLDALTEAAMERAEECLCNSYVQGELNYETERFQATGWWRINNE